METKKHPRTRNFFKQNPYKEAELCKKDENLPIQFYSKEKKRLRLKLNKCDLSFGPQLVISDRPVVISLPKRSFRLSLAISCEWQFQNGFMAYRRSGEPPCRDIYVPFGMVHPNT
jgi:hypothetical protein